jgi:peptidyl-prolyl cis-trans isomerase D
VDAKASASDKENTRKQAQSLLNQVTANPKIFADIAKKHSQDPGSASNGGDLGFFRKGAMVKPFEDVAFSIKQGEISEIVETEFGFHIIQLNEIKSSTQRSFDSVKNEIETEVKKQQAQRDFAEKAEIFGNLVYEQADSLSPVAEKLKLKVETAKGLIRKPQVGAVPEVLRHEKFLTQVFSSDAIKTKQNISAIETGTNQLIAARVLAHRPAAVSPLTEIQQQVEQRWLVTEGQRLARLDGEKALEALKSGANNTKLGAPILISRNDLKGLRSNALNAALSVNPAQLPTSVGVDQGAQGYMVIKVNKVVLRDPPPVEIARQELQQYEEWWSSAETTAYYRTLKQQFKVDIKIPKPKEKKDNLENNNT